MRLPPPLPCSSRRNQAGIPPVRSSAGPKTHLDRALPATAIAILEAIRLFLLVPRTAFVIGADEIMIEYAVRGYFPDLPPSIGLVPNAQSYLEKPIQVPFRIPALGLAATAYASPSPAQATWAEPVDPPSA